jgi:hypothetical protein
LPEAAINIGEDILMVLSDEQNAKFRDLCKEIKPGEYGRVVVSFMGEPSNLVQITGEKNYRFHSEKAEAACGEALDRRKSGRMG